MRRRDFLRASAAVAGGYVLGVGRPLPASAGLLDQGDVTLVGGATRIGAHTVDQGRTLRFDPDRDTTLELTGNLVVRGTLEMKPNRGVTHILRFVGINEASFVGGGMNVLSTDVGLWVMGSGRLDIKGEPRAGWNRTGSDPSWRSHDLILTTPFAPGDYTTFARFANTTQGGGLATVTAPDGQVFTQEAFNLTRSVRIEGTPHGRTHIFIRSSAPQSIRYAAIRYVGPRRPISDPQVPTALVLGRYGLHFHMCGNGSRGSKVVGTVVRDCGSHAFVPHMSDGVTFTDCVAYGANEDAFWWDPGMTTNDTTWLHCMAANVTPIPSFRGVRLAGFNLGLGTGNALRDSVAVGNRGNKQAPGFIWPESGSGLWQFENCIAHNNKSNGLFVWENTGGDHRIQDFVAFRNACGIEHGAYRNPFGYERCTTFENGRGLLIHAVSVMGPSGPLRWTDSSFRDGVAITQHSLPPEQPAVIADSLCSSVVVDDARGRSAGAYDFVRTGLQPSDWTVASMHPSSVYRVQDAGGAAYLVNTDGTTTPIPSFA